MAKTFRLTVGSLEGEGKSNEAKTSLDKQAMLVYAGKFESMDGPVEIKDEDIEKLAANHNTILSKLSRLATGDVPLRHSPPLQLDHSTSARDTVGRLVGELSIGEHTDSDGKKIKALFGTARILGKENIERVEDGRWTNLSGGFDLENHKVTELTITPFPAAADASLLSKKRFAYQDSYDNQDIVKEYKGYQIGLVVDDKGDMFWTVFDDESKVGGGKGSSESDCLQKAKKYIDTAGNHLSKHRFAKWKKHKAVEYKDQTIEVFFDENDPSSFVATSTNIRENGSSAQEVITEAKKLIDQRSKNLSKGEGDDMPSYKELKEKMGMYEKCKKHLMDKEKLSEEGADEKLAALGDEDLKKMSAERDEEDKKLAADNEEKEKLAAVEKEKELKRMSAMKDQKTQLIQLSKGITAANAKVQLAVKKSGIQVRLAKLQAQTKITPAEIKALNLDELVGKSEEVISATLSSYEKREPVIDVGLFGSTKALTAGQLQARLKKMGMEKLELETRLNMPSKAGEAKTRLAEIEEDEKALQSQVDRTEQPAARNDHEQVLAELKGMLAEGKHDEALSHLKKNMTGGQETATMGEQPVKEISALAEEVKKMQTNFDEVIKLAAPAFGITAEELA